MMRENSVFFASMSSGAANMIGFILLGVGLTRLFPHLWVWVKKQKIVRVYDERHNDFESLLSRYNPYFKSLDRLGRDRSGRIRHPNREKLSGVPLEEVQRAALILHVSDASSPLSAEQDAQVDRVLTELEAGQKPALHVKNKIDLLPPKQRDSLRDDARTVHVSAGKGMGLTTLLDRIDQMLSEDSLSRLRLRVPQKEGKALAMLEARSRIYSRKYKDGAVELEAELPESLARKLKEWVVVS